MSRIELSCMPYLISVTKCPVSFLVTFTITCGVEYGQVKLIMCPLNLSHKSKQKTYCYSKPNPTYDGLHFDLTAHFVN